VDLYYNKNQTGAFETLIDFMKLINKKGPYKPNTIDHLRPNGSINSIMEGNHVLCPDGVIKCGLSEDDAEALCFKFNYAYLVGKEDADVGRWKALKEHIELMEKSFEPHEEHDEVQYQCGICDAYCDLRQEMEKIEKGEPRNESNLL
jgi:hypothetical protein